MAEVAAIAIITAIEGHEKDLAPEVEGLVAPCRAEAGFVQYDLHRDVDHPGRWVIFERWVDRAAFDAHANAPHVLDYLARADKWLKSTELTILSKVG